VFALIFFITTRSQARKTIFPSSSEHTFKIKVPTRPSKLVLERAVPFILNPLLNETMNHRNPSGVTTTPLDSAFDEAAEDQQRTTRRLSSETALQLTGNGVGVALTVHANQHPLHTTSAAKPGKVTRRRNENRLASLLRCTTSLELTSSRKDWSYHPNLVLCWSPEMMNTEW
jgi:hypothetical protein